MRTPYWSSSCLRVFVACLSFVAVVLAQATDLAVTPAVRVQLQLGAGLNIQNGGVAGLRMIFGDDGVLLMGPNRRMKRTAAQAAEIPLIVPSDELVEV